LGDTCLEDTYVDGPIHRTNHKKVKWLTHILKVGVADIWNNLHKPYRNIQYRP